MSFLWWASVLFLTKTVLCYIFAIRATRSRVNEVNRFKFSLFNSRLMRHSLTWAHWLEHSQIPVTNDTKRLCIHFGLDSNTKQSIKNSSEPLRSNENFVIRHQINKWNFKSHLDCSLFLNCTKKNSVQMCIAMDGRRRCKQGSVNVPALIEKLMVEIEKMKNVKQQFDHCEGK